MDDHRFDRLARSMAAGLSRRRALKTLAAGIAGVAGLGATRQAGLADHQQAGIRVICSPGINGNGTCATARREIYGATNTCVTGAACTGPVVDASGRRECTFFFAAAGSPCNDGNACTANDVCDGAGHCVGQKVSCAGNACTTGICDPATGGCRYEDVTCSAPDACHTVGSCDPGSGCVYVEKDCSALDGPCSVGVCDRDTGNCRAVPAHTGQSCDGDDPCSRATTCQPDGTCGGGEPVVCPASDACHAAGTCNPGTGRCSRATLVADTCKSGRIKDGPCDCDGTCCGAGDNCVGKPGERRCKEKQQPDR